MPRLAYAAADIRAAERPRVEAGEPLMDRAAAGLARELRRLLAERGAATPPRVLVLAGSGDNGGDALLAAAELAREGAIVDVVPCGPRVHARGLDAALAAGARVAEADAAADVALALARGADVVLDGILGTGTSDDPALREPARGIVAGLLPLVSEPAGPLVVAVDVPSGVHPDTGASDGVVLPADATIAFGALKACLLVPPGAVLAGEVVLVDIGLGPDLARLEPLVALPD